MDPDSDSKPSATPGIGRSTQSIRDHLRNLWRGESKPELRVATGDVSDPDLEAVIPALLEIVKNTLGMDVVFVSEFRDGQRIFRYVNVPPDRPVIAAGGSDPIEASWCKRVVEGRLPQFIGDATLLQTQGKVEPAPFPIGTHMSVPIVLRNGRALGTVCCFSFSARPGASERDLDLLHGIAAFLAASAERGSFGASN